MLQLNHDIYLHILSFKKLNELIKYKQLSKYFIEIVNYLIKYKLKLTSVFNTIKKNTIFPKLKKLKIYNVLRGKYYDKEEQPILIN